MILPCGGRQRCFAVLALNIWADACSNEQQDRTNVALARPLNKVGVLLEGIARIVTKIVLDTVIVQAYYWGPSCRV